MNTRRHWTILAGVTLAMMLAAGGTEARAQTITASADLTNKEIGSSQALLGSLVADALRASAKTDAAFVSAAAFTESPVTVAHGAFKAADVVKTLAYKNETIAIVKLTGAQIRGALEQSLYQYPARNLGFLQTSGLTVTFNPAAAVSKRITAIKINDSALESGKTYRIAMPMPLANGAHAYFKFWKKTDIEKDTGINLEAALTNYLNEHKSIAKGEDRLVATGK